MITHHIFLCECLKYAQQMNEHLYFMCLFQGHATSIESTTFKSIDQLLLNIVLYIKEPFLTCY